MLVAVMSIRRTVPLLALCLAVALEAKAGGYVIARITDSLQNVETTIMTVDEYNNLRLAMNSERIKHGKAINMVLKKWKESEIDYKCPVRSIKPRKIIRMHSTRTYEQAAERFEFMTGLKVSVECGGGARVSTADQDSKLNQEYEERRKRYEESNAKIKERSDALVARAYNMYVDAMNELLAERYGQLGVSLEQVDEPAIPAKPAKAKTTRPVRRMGERIGRGLESTDRIEKPIGN